MQALRVWLLLFASLTCPVLCTATPPSPTITLSIDITPTRAHRNHSRPIQPDFLGLSIEWWHPRSWVGPSPSSLHRSFLSAARYLSSAPTVGPILRFGGSTTDESYLSSLPSPSWYNQATPTSPLDYATVIAAAAALNSSLILGINFRLGPNLSYALPEVDALHSLTQLRSLTLEVGNEPEAYDCHTQRYRPCGWSFSEYLDEWDIVTQAVLERYPTAPRHLFQAGAFAGGWTPQLPQLSVPRAAVVRSASFHRYAFPTCDLPLTIDDVLSDDVSLAGLLRPVAPGQTLQSIAQDIQEGTDGAVLVSLGEGGMRWCLNGDPGVMDRFGAALWMVDYSLALASLNLSSFVYYTGWLEPPVFRASPFLVPNATEDAVTVLPILYGMWTFALATWNGARVIDAVRVDSAPAPLVKTWALRDDDGNVVVVVVHKAYHDRAAASVGVSVTNDEGLTSKAVVARLEAASVVEGESIHLAGLSFRSTADGNARAVNGKGPVVERVNGTTRGGKSTWEIKVTPASVVVIVIPTDATAAESSWQRRQTDVLRFVGADGAARSGVAVQ